MPKEKPVARQRGEVVDKLDHAGCLRVRALNARFSSKLPEEARRGPYDAKAGDGFNEEPVDVPDGIYRVFGSDWLLRIRKGEFVSAVRATEANNFGGPNVISIDSDA